MCRFQPVSLLGLAGPFNVHFPDKGWNKEDNSVKTVETFFCLFSERSKDESDKCQTQDTSSRIEPQDGIEVWSTSAIRQRIGIVQPVKE